MISSVLRRLAALLAAAALTLTARAEERLLPVYRVERSDGRVALSFDAAWGNEDTQRLIDILAEHNVHATFFVVGQWVRKYPESVRALSRAGHEVMNHSDTHPHMPGLSEEEIIREIEACNGEVEAVTGVRPTLIRLPYGDYDNRVISAVRSLGMTAVQWDVDSLDWKDLSAGEIYERVTSRVKSGSIVLFHNAAKHTPEALGDILDWLEANGLEPVPVSGLLLPGDHPIDPNGTQLASAAA